MGDLESGPFCRHWMEAGSCGLTCGACGHGCERHELAEGRTGCTDCECAAWSEPRPLTREQAYLEGVAERDARVHEESAREALSNFSRSPDFYAPGTREFAEDDDE